MERHEPSPAAPPLAVVQGGMWWMWPTTGPRRISSLHHVADRVGAWAGPPGLLRQFSYLRAPPPKSADPVHALSRDFGRLNIQSRVIAEDDRAALHKARFKCWTSCG